MNITMENFKTAKYDVFSIFDDRWGLCTAGTLREYNTMTIGWGTMGTIWGPPKKGKQIITVFIRESRRTHQILQKEDEFTVCFFQRNIGRILESWDQNREMMCRIRSV
ncbi:MAG: hypothetical protein ACLRIL_12030 [Fusicatenibacter saccharivorans]